jgi:energy-coupling factor transporter ATP-binding protein EcfA2
MNGRIKNVILKNFRGATNSSTISFDTNKPISFIFGENGTGKSTIIDAIDFTANQEFGSITDRASSNPIQSLPSIGAKTSDIEIQIDCDSKKCRAKLISRKANSDHPENLPCVKILRRSQLLKLIEAIPSERYKAFQTFIDVQNIEKCEKTLSDAIKEVKNQIELASNNKIQAIKALQSSYLHEVGKEDQIGLVMAWAVKLTQANISEKKEQKKLIEFFVSAVSEYKQAFKNLRSRQDEKTKLEKEVEKANTHLTNIQNTSKAGSEALISVLNEAKNYLASQPDEGVCPVCEQTANLSTLLSSIDNRLLGFTDLQTAISSYKSANDKLKISETNYQRELGTLITKFTKACQSLIDILTIVQLDNLQELKRSIENSFSVCASEEKLSNFLNYFENQIETSNIILEKITNEIALQSSIQYQINLINEASSTINQKEVFLKRMSSMLSVVESTRKSFTNEILAAVSGECQSIYQQIHEDERIGISSFELDEKQRASLNQLAFFETQDNITPQMYFSEAHLDTLGFSLWLALARISSSGNAILVLDDVFTSVDSPHLMRVLKVIEDQTNYFKQIIIASHNGHWLTHYKKNQSVDLIELREWTLSRGISSVKSIPDIDNLKNALKHDPIDRQVVASKAGILLEHRFDDIAKQYEAKMPYSKSLTLGDFESGLKKIVSNIIITRTINEKNEDGNYSEKKIQIELKPLFESLFELSFVRNQLGAHANSLGDEIPNTEVKQYAKRTIDLAEALICPDCGTLINRKKADHFECRCGKTTMTPLPVH